MNFTNKVVWITGASSGIGAELARQLAAKKAILVLTARNENKLRQLATECESLGSNSHILPFDLYHIEQLGELTKKAVSFNGHIDIVIHSAGISQRSLAAETQPEVYRQLMDINFFAPVYITSYLLPHFKARNAGDIVVLNSVAGLMGFPMRSGYSAAKHALKGYFETLQVELRNTNIHTTLVYPGRINTPISLSAMKGDGSAHGSMDEGQVNGIRVDSCATKIIDALAARKKRVIIAKGERLLWWFWFLAHSLYQRISFIKGMPEHKEFKK